MDAGPPADFTAFGGDDIRVGTRMVGTMNQGFRGGSGAWLGSGAIRMGVLEHKPVNGNNWLNTSHVGFRTGSLTRIMGQYDCPATGSCALVYPGSTIPTHGTIVTAVAAGSIEGGQDTAITDPFERRQRSGTAPDSQIFYFRAQGGCGAMTNSITLAMQASVDVLNVSIGYAPDFASADQPSPYCAPTVDCGGLNVAIRNATDAGVLIVGAMGNTRDVTPDDVCNPSYPTTRREVLGVGAVDTTQRTQPYDTRPLLSSSSRGGTDIVLSSGPAIPGAFAVADLAAPGAVSYFYTGGTNGYTATNAFSAGTSIAAPVVAGAAGVLRNYFATIGWPYYDARVALVNMLLLGDAYSADAGADRLAGFDQRSGAGRLHFHVPDDFDLVAPWGWGSHVVTIGPNQTIEFPVWGVGPESAYVRQWKVAMTWKEDNYQSVADIVLEVFNICPSSGPEVEIRSDWSYDIRKRVELQQSEIGGRCLVYRVRTFPWSMPAGQTRTVYVADYFHGGNPLDH